MFIAKKHLSMRTLLRGAGAAIALPLLDSMVPARTALAQTAATPKSRLGCIYIPHGATMDKWTPKTTGSNFEFSEILKPLEPFRERVCVISDLANASVGPWPGEDTGGAENHTRAAPAFLTGAHPVKSEQATVGASIDQIVAQAVGQDTPLPSIELTITPYSEGCRETHCSYRAALAWKNPTLPLPMEDNPQVVFQRLFGDGSNDAERRERREQGKSLLDGVIDQVAGMNKALPRADRARLGDYLDEVREAERRVHLFDSKMTADLALPEPPVGVPDRFEDHINLLFDLQVLAYKAEITRISTLLLSREGGNTVFPGSGVREGFHNASHHSNDRKNMDQFAVINRYHITVLAGFLERLRATPDGDGNLLDHSLILYGSSLSDANQHNFNPLPMLLAGGASGRLKGNRHLRTAPDTPSSTLLLSMLNMLDVPLEKFGDSTEPLNI